MDTGLTNNGPIGPVYPIGPVGPVIPVFPVAPVVPMSSAILKMWTVADGAAGRSGGSVTTGRGPTVITPSLSAWRTTSK